MTLYNKINSNERMLTDCTMDSIKFVGIHCVELTIYMVYF